MDVFLDPARAPAGAIASGSRLSRREAEPPHEPEGVGILDPADFRRYSDELFDLVRRAPPSRGLERAELRLAIDAALAELEAETAPHIAHVGAGVALDPRALRLEALGQAVLPQAGGLDDVVIDGHDPREVRHAANVRRNWNTF